LEVDGFAEVNHKMKKILIIIERSEKHIKMAQTIFLGPLYVLSYLESRNIVADFWDKYTDPDKKYDYADYDAIGFSVNINNFTNSFKTAALIKSISPKTEIVFGGPFASGYPELTLRNSAIDVVVAGEGEETFYEYAAGMPKHSIKGIYFKDNGTVQFTGKRSWNKNLDALPFPALNRINFRKSNMLMTRALPVSSIVTSRGCPFQCAFCFHNMGHEWRGRSAKNVVDEIEWQVKELGVRELIITDDNFTFDRKRAEEIFDEIVARKIKISIQCNNGLRADFLDENILRKAKAAGVWIICLAPETGSPQTLEKLNKKFRLEDVKRTIQIARSVGLATEAYFLIGLPWETQKDIEKTLAFALDLDIDFVAMHRFIPFPGASLTNTEHLAIEPLDDYSYSAYTAADDKLLRKMLASFYWKFKLRPRRIYGTLKLIPCLFSWNKLSHLYVMKDLLLTLWEDVINMF
jgi:anaerobic magnesium-protoporphyrin IX monomethyl ester cyclase